MKRLFYSGSFTTESGFVFEGLEIAYDTWGRLNEKGTNVIWVCHALTANSDVDSWWPGMTGPGCAFDTDKYFVVCANILGSCYGTTGPLTESPSAKQWLGNFPVVTVRDAVNVHEILRRSLGITEIQLITGSSIGGYQAIEYCIMCPDLIKNMVFIASAAKQSPWAIAFDESQRLAIEADHTFHTEDPSGGAAGMRAARSIGLLSYRTPYAYNTTQAENDDNKTGFFRASSYQAYQGDKLVKRFNAWSYYRLTQLADSHNVGRGRGGVAEALLKVQARTLCIGIKSDILYPPEDQKVVAEGVPDGSYVEIDSFYGHDGFLIETGQVTGLIKKFLK